MKRQPSSGDSLVPVPGEAGATPRQFRSSWLHGANPRAGFMARW